MARSKKAQQAVTETTEQPVEEQVAEAKAPREKREHVEPARFAQVLADLGLSRKEAAAAIGRSLSRISELTHSQGASITTYEAFVKACTEYAEAHPRATEHPATEEPAKPTKTKRAKAPKPLVTGTSGMPD